MELANGPSVPTYIRMKWLVFVMAGLVPPSTSFLPNSAKDVDARQRRQAYAVCARQTAAGHDDYR
jgi:hypothetical protein